MDGRMERRTDRRTYGPTKQGVESRSTRLKSTWFCATIAMQKHGFVSTLKASFNESSQRGVRAKRVSVSSLRALRDSQTLRELSNSRNARGPASEEEEEEEEEE